MKTIRETFREERMKLGITQEDIAEHLSTKQTNISYTEKSLDNNSIIRYLRFLRYKGIDLNAIFDALMDIDENIIQ